MTVHFKGGVSENPKRVRLKLKSKKMKTIQNLLVITFVVLLTSCATTTKFPLSSTVPAAEISAKINQDKNKNFVINVVAKNLASADRLNPPKNNYSVWMITDDGTLKNIGQLTNQNAKTASLKTLTPFKVKEIFITAEDQGNLTYPSGIEISRTSFNK